MQIGNSLEIIAQPDHQQTLLTIKARIDPGATALEISTGGNELMRHHPTHPSRPIPSKVGYTSRTMGVDTLARAGNSAILVRQESAREDLA